MAKKKTRSKAKARPKKVVEAFDVKGWIDTVPKAPKCQTCAHPEAPALLVEALTYMAEKESSRITRDDLHGMLIQACKKKPHTPYTVRTTAFRNHLKRCVPDLWAAAKGTNGQA